MICVRGFIKGSPRANRQNMANKYREWVKSKGFEVIGGMTLYYIGDGVWTTIYNTKEISNEA